MSKSPAFTVAMVTTWEDPCGIADYAHALVPALENEIRVEVVNLKKNGGDRRFYRAVATAANSADLVHVQHEYAFFGGLGPGRNKWRALSSALRKPLVMTAHTWLQPFQGGPWWKKTARVFKQRCLDMMGWTRYLQSGQFQAADALIVHHPGFKAYLQEQGLKQDRIFYYPQGVDLEPPLAGESAIIQQLGLAGKRVLVLYGFLMPSKGHVLAMEAMAGLPDDVVLVIVGAAGSHRTERAYARQVSKQARTLGARCVLTGYLPAARLHALIEHADLCLFPYTAATSSYALSLAMSHRKACVTSSLDNFLAINREVPCLAVFETGRAQALNRVVMELLVRPDKRSQLQEAAGQWVGRHHWGILAQEHLAIYRRVLGVFQ